MCKKCFFVSPIGEEDSKERIRSNKVMKYLLKPVLSDLGFKITRADEINSTDKIDDSIYKNLYKSDLVIADITGLNPNVFLELGYRMSLNDHLDNLPLIIIKDECDKSKIPFDIVTHPVNQYTFDVEGSDDFKIKLKSIINAIDFKQKRVTLVNAKGERLFIKD